jgi:hypothetical protein
MATSLFHVKALSKQGNTVRLRLRIITGEQTEFPSSHYFALMVLYDSVDFGRIKAPLADAMTIDNVIDREWLDDNVDRFIQSVSLSEVVNLPVRADLESMSSAERRRFWRGADAPHATLEITVVAPEWIEHIRKGRRAGEQGFRPVARMSSSIGLADVEAGLYVQRILHLLEVGEIAGDPDIAVNRRLAPNVGRDGIDIPKMRRVCNRANSRYSLLNRDIDRRLVTAATCATDTIDARGVGYRAVTGAT